MDSKETSRRFLFLPEYFLCIIRMTLQKALQKSDSNTSASNPCCLWSQEFGHQLNWCSLSVVPPIVKALRESPGVRRPRDHRDAQKETPPVLKLNYLSGFHLLLFFSPSKSPLFSIFSDKKGTNLDKKN